MAVRRHERIGGEGFTIRSDLPTPGTLTYNDALVVGPDHEVAPVADELAVGTRPVAFQFGLVRPAVAESLFASEFRVAPSFHRMEAVQIPLENGRSVDGIAYYPVEESADVVAPASGWPGVLLVPGQAPSEIPQNDIRDDVALCDGGGLDDDEVRHGLPLYRRWGALQASLADAGIASVAYDVRSPRPDIAGVRDWFLEEGGGIDPSRFGVVAHSAGTIEVRNAEGLGALGVVLIGPAPRANEVNRAEFELGFDLPLLVVGSIVDDNQFTREIYDAGGRPKHLLLVRPQTHFSYFDGLCQSNNRNRIGSRDARRQALVAAAGIRRFFERYLLGDAGVPNDLGVVGLDGVASACGDTDEEGDTCGL